MLSPRDRCYLPFSSDPCYPPVVSCRLIAPVDCRQRKDFRQVNQVRSSPTRPLHEPLAARPKITGVGLCRLKITVAGEWRWRTSESA
jgi:hypothetical protein